MNRNAYMCCLIALALVILAGCSSTPAANETKKAAAALETIQGKAQVIEGESEGDSALNLGGSPIYLWAGTHQYRLFLRKAAEVVRGKDYVVEGIDAQKAIDAIGDPDNGKNGYPLPGSCSQVVKMAWGELAFDDADAQASLLRGRIARYPARTVFLVTKITPAESATPDAKEAEKGIPEIEVPADKQQALLAEGSTVLPAPLWQPDGGTASCKVEINSKGIVDTLNSGSQLCEALPWDNLRYRPNMQGGKPVRVKTDVEVRFDAKK